MCLYLYICLQFWNYNDIYLLNSLYHGNTGKYKKHTQTAHYIKLLSGEIKTSKNFQEHKVLK